MTRVSVVLAAAALCAGCAGTGMQQPGGTGVVKITPLGSHDGELCSRDRAMVFEDPDGTRILYDAGFTVRGPNDPRLGKIDAVLLSHVHGDHLGPGHQPAANAGTCGNPDFSVNVTPNSFYDGGRYEAPEAGRQRVVQLLAEGADILDIGAESSKPGAPRVPATWYRRTPARA